LTLLTSTLSWLAANKKRLEQATEDNLRSRLTEDDPDGEPIHAWRDVLSGADEPADPPWVIEHALKSRLADLRAVQDAHHARLAGAREKERQRREKSGLFRGAKRVKVDHDGARVEREDKGDEEFLPEDTAADAGNPEAEGGNISQQVRELMAKYVP
jgi:chromosome transmission fidelity protein 1